MLRNVQIIIFKLYLKMDNDSHTQDNHRGSVSSNKSLEIPVTPSRSPKKVSFSDELPSSSNSYSATPSSNPNGPSEPSGVSQVLQQAVQYLERLHGSRDYATENISEQSSSMPAVLDLDAESLQLETPMLTATSPSILIAEPAGDDDAAGGANGVNGVNAYNGKQEVPTKFEPTSNLYMERYKLNLDKNCSSMELEARREKQRWLLISECSARFGEGKHTREAFRKLFLDEVSTYICRCYDGTVCYSYHDYLLLITLTYQ